MKKKIPGIIMLLTGLLLLAAGCGKQQEEGAGSEVGGSGRKEEEAGTEVILSWKASHTALEDSYELATVKEDKVYGCFLTDGVLTVSVQDIGAGGNSPSQEVCRIPGVSEIQNITVDSQERICLFGTAQNGATLWQVEENGEIHVIENIEVEDADHIVSPKAFFADDKGHYYLWYVMDFLCTEVYENGEEGVYTLLDRIYVKDADMKTLCYEQVPDSHGNKLLSLLFDEEGTPMLLARDEEGYYTRRVRTGAEKEYEPCRLDEVDEAVMYDLESGGNLALAQTGLLYTRDGALHLYHTEEGRDEKLLELAGGGILEEDIIYLGMRGDTVEIIDNYEGGEGSAYTVLEAGEAGEMRLSLGVMTLDPKMRSVIAAFNREQDEIMVEPIVYVEGYDYDAGYERLKLDVIQGKAPDLIDTDGIDYEILANAGAFMDLYGFMEGDPECGREMLLDSVRKAYEINGCLYTVAPGFNLHTVWGGGSLVQGRRGVDMEELIGILRDHGGDINSIYGFSADESVLRTLCSLGMGEFIHWEDNTCDFTGEEFCHLLEFAKEYQGKQIESLYGAIQGKEVLLTLGVINGVEDYCLESELYGENVQFIGYPTGEGTGSAVQFMGSQLAINAKTGNAQKAWEFIKYYLLHGYDGIGFPVMTKQWEDVLEASMEETETLDENGHSSKVPKAVYQERDVVSIPVYRAEQGDVDAVRELVEGAEGKFQYYNEIQNIIDEEAEAYFQNQKTLEEVTRIIQNRVQLYLNETL